MYSDHFSFNQTQEKYRQILGHKEILTENLFDSPYHLFGQLSDHQLELLARKSTYITRQRFGHVMRFFIPLYLSNECFNNCTYCSNRPFFLDI